MSFQRSTALPRQTVWNAGCLLTFLDQAKARFVEKDFMKEFLRLISLPGEHSPVLVSHTI
jgi:hypothetical protein